MQGSPGTDTEGRDAPLLAVTRLTAADRDPPLLVALPSLGTTTTLWRAVGAALGREVDVLGVDLPGHGASAPAEGPFGVEDLATAVLAVVDEHRGPSARFHLTGDSLGGAVALAAAVHAPDRVLGLVPVCTGARIGEPSAWHDRAALVRAHGTAAVVESSRERWFAAGFAAREPGTVRALLSQLPDVHDESYALACEALAAFDLRPRLHSITAPTVVVSGSHDVATPPDLGTQTAHGITGARHVVLDGVGHLAPVEAPGRVAELLREIVAGGTARA